MLTILLPSIHPHSLQRMLKNLSDTIIGHTYLVVLTPEHMVLDTSLDEGDLSGTWVIENGRLGSAGAQAEAVKFAPPESEFVMALSDDVVMLEKGWDEIVIENFVRRERQTTARPFCLDMRMGWGGVNAIFGRAYATLPLMRKFDVDKYGWYDPIFFSRYGDNDLGLRIWSVGGRVEWSERPIIDVHPDNATNGMNIRYEDQIKFLQRWQSQFPDWPNDPSRYDCGIAMDKIGFFEGNTTNIPTYIKYHQARAKAGHRDEWYFREGIIS
jgi:hypothetical protein